MKTCLTAHRPTRLLTALSVSVVVAIVGASGGGVARAAANPLVTNQASASGFPAGSQIYDSATLGNAVNPTGSLTFKVFGPEDATCAGTPLLTTTTAVVANGYHESSRFTTNAAGTYRWTVFYGGDANNNATPPTLCGDPAGQVMVARRVPVLNASPTWAPPSATDTAVLTGGSGPNGPTGTMTFKLYGPLNMTCAGLPIFTSVRNVAGNGSYPSESFSPTVAGTYQWVVAYGGDTNNVARSTICSDTANGFTVVVAPPAVLLAVPVAVLRGGTVTASWSAIAAPTTGDWLAVYKVGTPDGGPVVAWKYTGGSKSGSTTLKFPWPSTPGSYEVRLMADNTTRRLATSLPLTLAW
jgi:hypothetical protein